MAQQYLPRYVVLVNDRSKDQWDIFHGSNASGLYLLTGNTIQEVDISVIAERELNEPSDWDSDGFRILDTQETDLYRWDSNTFEYLAINQNNCVTQADRDWFPV